MKDTITIPAPRIDTGPSVGAFPQRDAANYLESVRVRFPGETTVGRGVRDLVDALLSDVIRAIRATEPAEPVGAAEHVRRSTPPEYVDVVLAEADDVSRFLEIEGPGGYSLRVGEEIVDQHGYRRIRITGADLAPPADLEERVAHVLATGRAGAVHFHDLAEVPVGSMGYTSPSGRAVALMETMGWVYVHDGGALPPTPWKPREGDSFTSHHGPANDAKLVGLLVAAMGGAS